MSAIRRAGDTDLPAILALLAEVDLPIAGVAPGVDAFVVAESEPAATSRPIVGVGGLELCGSVALLRSVAVDPACRDSGIGTRLCDRLKAAAAARGVRGIYLLTETAERFFARRGYVRIDRANAPPEIAATAEFSEVCPETAVLMTRQTGIARDDAGHGGSAE